MRRYLAIDVGATSGRHIAGWEEDGVIRQEEIYRFQNGAVKKDGHLTWDLDLLFEEVVNGIRCAFSRYPDIRSLSIDTWGTDYVLMNNDRPILPCYAYRDSRVEESVPEVHKIIPFSELYERCGYQFVASNTIYQLYWDKMKGRMDAATDFLMIPEYLIYRLSGVKVKEATNASTTSLVDPRTRQFDPEIIRKLGFPQSLFPALRPPGQRVGALLPEIAEKTGASCSIVLCATHDTNSAISAIPMDPGEIYISSGTWSLLGVKLDEPLISPEGAAAGFSNESGLEYICYLTNLAGMWMPERLRAELCPEEDYGTIVRMAKASGYCCAVDPNLPQFNAPDSMAEAIRSELSRMDLPLPESSAEYFSCAYHSIAASYRSAIGRLEGATGKTYHKIYITGGGARNEFLNELTASYTGKSVIALPFEASTQGNIAMQIRADRS